MREYFRDIPTPRLLLALLLLALLFCIGTYDEAVFAGLTRFWHSGLSAIGLGGWAQRLQQGTSSQITTRSLPAMLTYGLGYTSICLFILGLVLPRRAWHVALLLYGGVFGLSAALLVLGKVAGNVVWLYQLGRRLIDFIVSPLPVVVLVPLLRWAYPPPAAPDRPNAPRPVSP